MAGMQEAIENIVSAIPSNELPVGSEGYRPCSNSTRRADDKLPWRRRRGTRSEASCSTG